MKTAHLLHVPWTGLGNFGGFRGNRWYKNRIEVFRRFVIPSLQAQTCQDFIVWCGFRYEEKTNPLTKKIKEHLDAAGIKNFFTFSGVALWDDKYPTNEARLRLIDCIHGASEKIIENISDSQTILLTIQPSDDCYESKMVEGIQQGFRRNDYQAIGFKRGYIMDYRTLEIREWNPETNPPFYTIKFDRETFLEPLKHVEYAGHESHEYVPEKFRYGIINDRGFIVGVHGENISTVVKHPYSGPAVPLTVLERFGLSGVSPLKIKESFRRKMFRRFPYKAQRKLRYWAGEKKWFLRPFFAWIYEAVRS